MSESYSKQIQDEITQKYHWVNGLDEYLIQTKSPHLDKFTAFDQQGNLKVNIFSTIIPKAVNVDFKSPTI